MKYIAINKEEIDLSGFYSDLEEIIIEIFPDGKVKREIGLDKDKRIIHIYPSSNYKYGNYGIFDNNIIEEPGNDLIIKETFENFWNQA